MQTFLLRTLLAMSGIAVLGSLLYYALPVTWLGLTLITLLCVLGAAFAPLPADLVPPRAIAPLSTWLRALLVIIPLIAWWAVLSPIAITTAVRSPWGEVTPFLLATLGIAIFACVVMAAVNDRHNLPLLFILTLFAALSVAAIVYPLGFGFDPFLHRATVAHIAEHGTITPKPLYYIGQYALELVGLKVLRLPLISLDRYLLPVFAALALSTSFFLGLLPILKRKALLALAAIFLLPLGAVVATTPQGIAYVFAASAFALSLARLRGKSIPLYVLILLAVAAAFTHPFAGIPAVLYVASLTVMEHLPVKHRTVGLVVSGLLATLAIPVVFALQALNAGLSLKFAPGNFFSLASWHELALTAFASNHFSTIYDGLYLVIDNLLWIVLALGILGCVFLLRERDSEVPTHRTLLPLVFAAGMLLNFLILSLAFNFDFLIAYERTDYALRSLTMTQFFLLPYVGVTLAVLDRKLEEKPLVLRASFLLLITLIAVGNVYGAYPRHDNYARSAGFNVSSADIDAVYAIDKAADGENYIVLANQATSAAAVEELGFKQYYHTDIFYYPIPTGGPLYQHFLTMVDDNPSRETMLAAMDLAGVDLAFFAVSDYWWKSSELIENTKRLADEWFAVSNGAVTVFIFRR